MENTTETKLPFHTSSAYKQMKADGLINEDKEYIGSVPLQEYLDSIESGNPIPNTAVEKPIVTEPQEPMVKMSDVKNLVAEMLADSQRNASQQIQPQFQGYPVKQQFDIDDIPEFKDWEVRDREYEYIENGEPKKPVSASIASKHTDLIPLQYFNKEKNSVHTLRYSSNQPSFFVEKQSKEPGSVLIPEIIFSFGRLKVPASEINLQKFLHINPYKGVTFREFDAKVQSVKKVNAKKLISKAVNLVSEVGEQMNRAIASLKCAGYVESWIPEFVEEQVIDFAEKNPQEYIDLTEDSTVKMKGIIKSALAKGDLIYSNYRCLNGNRDLLVEVGKNQDELDEMVKYFESGVGRTTYDYLVNSKN